MFDCQQSSTGHSTYCTYTDCSLDFYFYTDQDKLRSTEIRDCTTITKDKKIWFIN